MSAPRGPRGRGRGGRGRGGNFFNQQSDGDIAMTSTREDFRDDFQRGRGRSGRGRGGDFFQPNQRSDDRMAVADAQDDYRDNSQQGRGRGRGRARGRAGQPFNQHQNGRQQHEESLDYERDQAKNETFQLLEGFLGRRYNPNTKLLDLSNIALDEEVRKSGMFDSEKTQKKFFPALMVVIDTMLPERGQKIAAIDSVSLSNNSVPNLNVIYELVKTLNHIKNLDLSGNKFANLSPLKPWKNRFKFLEHLIVDPFPELNWEEELIDWFPKLCILNGKQIRPDSAAPQGAPTNAIMGAPNNQAELIATPSQPAELMAAPVAPISVEQQKKEEMIAFVQQATNLTRDFAIQCLEAGQWDLQQASDLFTSSRHTLPPNAFN